MTSFIKVVILQHRLLHYRTSFFEKLKYEAQNQGIIINLVHGQATTNENQKKDVGFLSWAYQVKNYYLNLFGKDILWQPFPRVLKDAELIVMMQENRLISNYFHIVKHTFYRGKLAFWGHGANFQSNSPNGIRETWKRMILRQVDWWFGYTELTEKVLIDASFPKKRITILNNAIDNQEFIDNLAYIKNSSLNLRQELGLQDDSLIGLFCGSLYDDKRIDLLLSASKLIKNTLPNFHLIIIGDGPKKIDILNAAQEYPWIIWVGSQKGINKAKYFNIASVILNPGLVGLHVLDSFHSGVPMVTTENAKHSPEISYLINLKNGLIVPDNTIEYSNSVINLLRDEYLYAQLKNGALSSAKLYTMDKMINNFILGIKNCINS